MRAVVTDRQDFNVVDEGEVARAQVSDDGLRAGDGGGGVHAPVCLDEHGLAVVCDECFARHSIAQVGKALA